jgi:hypothetical protein
MPRFKTAQEDEEDDMGDTKPVVEIGQTREGLLFVFFPSSVAGGQTRGLTTPFQVPSASSETCRKEEEVVMNQGFRKEPIPGALLWRRTTVKCPRKIFPPSHPTRYVVALD